MAERLCSKHPSLHADSITRNNDWKWSLPKVLRWSIVGIRFIGLALYSLFQSIEKDSFQATIGIIGLVFTIGDCSSLWILHRKLLRPDRVRTALLLAHTFLLTTIVEVCAILVFWATNWEPVASVFLAVLFTSAAHHTWIAFNIVKLFRASLGVYTKPPSVLPATLGITERYFDSPRVSSVVSTADTSCGGPFAKAFWRQQGRYMRSGGLKSQLQKQADRRRHISLPRNTNERDVERYHDNAQAGNESEGPPLEQDETGMPLTLIRSGRRLTLDQTPLKRSYQFTNFDALALPCLAGILILSPIVIVIEILFMFRSRDSLVDIEAFSYVLLTSAISSFVLACALLTLGLKQVSLDDGLLHGSTTYNPKRRNFLALCLSIISLPPAILVLCTFPVTVIPLIWSIQVMPRAALDTLKGVVRIKDLWPGSRIHLIRELATSWVAVLVWICLEIAISAFAFALASVLFCVGGFTVRNILRWYKRSLRSAETLVEGLGWHY